MPNPAMEIHLVNLETKSTHIFSILDIYKSIRFWLIQNGYVDHRDTNFPETNYWESRTQTRGTEFWIWWRPKKTVADNRFWRRVIDIDFHGVGITDVDIMYQGQKIRVQKGKFEILMRIKLELDVGGRWRKSKLMSNLLAPFWRKIWRRELDMQKRDIMFEAYRLQDHCKKFFKMPMLYQPDMKPFIPMSGYEEEPY
ncbi:MAG: hypothetical protein QXK37_03455 [Candidatus Woesearchaeota archaeon]